MRMRARDDLTPRRAAGLWPAHERREGLAQHAPPVGGNLWGCGSGEGRRRLRSSAGAAAAEVPTLKAVDDAKVPAMPTGTRVTTRARTIAPLPATLTLHLDVSIPRQAQGRYVA